VKIYSYDGTLKARCALKLLTMLHVRPGNLRPAMGCDFDLINGWWQIPGDEMKDSQHDKPFSVFGITFSGAVVRRLPR